MTAKKPAAKSPSTPAHAKTPDIAVVAQVEPAALLALLAVGDDLLDAATERAVAADAGRVGVGKD